MTYGDVSFLLFAISSSLVSDVPCMKIIAVLLIGYHSIMAKSAVSFLDIWNVSKTI